jgi:hypothetical protein
MKKALIAVGLFAGLLWSGALLAQNRVALDSQSSASIELSTDAPMTAVTATRVSPHSDVCTPQSDVATLDVGPLAKKCSFSSDCSHGKCKNGKCGACSFKSDCKGWGKCSKGKCGACSFSSECKGFGKCSSGRCTKSPY